MNWYVLLTEPQREATAVAGLVGRGVHAYGPVLRKKIIRRGRKIDAAEPMFPGYVFALLVPGRDDFRVPRRVPGVRDYLRAVDRKPCVMPAGAVDAISEREGLEFDRFMSRKGQFKFAKGQDVRVSEGPFWGFAAVVERMDERGRVEALLHLFGRSSRVSFDVGQLEAV